MDAEDYMPKDQIDFIRERSDIPIAKIREIYEKEYGRGIESVVVKEILGKKKSYKGSNSGGFRHGLSKEMFLEIYNKSLDENGLADIGVMQKLARELTNHSYKNASSLVERCNKYGLSYNRESCNFKRRVF